MTADKDGTGAQTLVANTRREIFTALALGGGALALLGCESVSSGGSSSSLDAEAIATSSAALSGAGIMFCDTTAEQQLLTGGNAAVCIRRGYSTPGDGGGGVFVWTTDKTMPQVTTDAFGQVLSMDGIVVVPTTSGTRRGCWKRAYSGLLDIRWFGAVGNGSSDDTLAIRAAIATGVWLQANAPSPNDRAGIWIPSGSFRVQSDVFIPSNFEVAGEGRSSVIYWPGQPDPRAPRAVFKIMGADGRAGALNVDVRGIAFRGDNGDTASTFQHATGSQIDMLSAAIHIGAEFTNLCQNIAIRDCWFENLYGFGIESGGSGVLKQINIQNCVFRFNGNGAINVHASLSNFSGNLIYNAEGIETLGFQTILANNVLAGWYNMGISIYGDNTVVQGNLIDMRECIADSPDAAPNGIVAVGVLACVISGNTIIDAPETGILINSRQLPLEPRDPRDVSINGNTIITRRVQAHTGAAFPELIMCSNVTNLVIQANTLTGTLNEGSSTTVGIGLFSCSHASIRGNTISSCGVMGIDLEGLNNDATIANNIVTGVGFTGIAIQANSNSIALIGNTARGATLDMRVDRGATKVRLIANTANTVALDGVAVKYSAGNSWQDT